MNAVPPAGSPQSTSGGKKPNSRLSSHCTLAKRAVKSSPAQQDLHPVFRFGYPIMCEVHCNGLQGLFLGGHDRDLYIQCISHEYSDLPLIDANLGGCIMSCSHFERAAGRELSKKWKESIHVVGEGEGSKATLLAWLKRRADAMSPDIVGSLVWVCWCNEAESYQGTIVSFNRESGKHKVCSAHTVAHSVSCQTIGSEYCIHLLTRHRATVFSCACSVQFGCKYARRLLLP